MRRRRLCVELAAAFRAVKPVRKRSRQVGRRSPNASRVMASPDARCQILVSHTCKGFRTVGAEGQMLYWLHWLYWLYWLFFAVGPSFGASSHPGRPEDVTLLGGKSLVLAAEDLAESFDCFGRVHFWVESKAGGRTTAVHGQKRRKGGKSGRFLKSCTNRTGRCIIKSSSLGMKNLRTRTCRFSGKISDWRSQNHS